LSKDELLTVTCPVCGKKLLRTKQGEIEIQCPKCKQMLEAGVDRHKVIVYVITAENAMKIAESADAYHCEA